MLAHAASLLARAPPPRRHTADPRHLVPTPFRRAGLTAPSLGLVSSGTQSSVGGKARLGVPFLSPLDRTRTGEMTQAPWSRASGPPSLPRSPSDYRLHSVSSMPRSWVPSELCARKERRAHVCHTRGRTHSPQEPVTEESSSILGREGPRRRTPQLGGDRPDRPLFHEETFQQQHLADTDHK